METPIWILEADEMDVARGVTGHAAPSLELAADLLPRSILGVRTEADTAVATWRIGDEDEAAKIRVGPDGRLVQGLLQRWGNPDRHPFARYPFGIAFDVELTFDGGVTIPSVVRAGWWWCTDRQDAGEFFRAEITHAVFR